MDLRTQVNQKQELRMSQETIQSLKVLQMSKLELSEYIKSELIDNPALEEVGARSDSVSTEAMEERLSESRDDYDRFDAYDSYDGYADGRDYGYDSQFASAGGVSEYEKFTAQDQTLQEHLVAQLNSIEPSSNVKLAAEYFIGSIDDSGYILSDYNELIEECAKNISCSTEEAKEALNIVQSMDPIGVASTCLEECLLAQADYICNADDSLCKKISISVDELRIMLHKLICDMLSDIAENRIAVIAGKLNITKSEAQELVDIVKRLEPKPGRRFSDGRAVMYIVPDIIVDIDEDGSCSLRLNNRDIPKVVVNSYYKNLMAESQQMSEENREEIKAFLGSRINAAEQLIANIRQRGDTITRVTEAIIKRQSQFFEPGNRMLKPLTLQTIAEDTGLHLSTVSRTVSGKYLHCAGNTYALQYFFDCGVTQKNSVAVIDEEGKLEESDSAIAASVIKAAIKELIDSEDKKHPLSDAKIMAALNDRGIEVSRRTIAKYRDEMGILATSKRKRY